jgi:mannose-6-phosphate isomerase
MLTKKHSINEISLYPLRFEPIYQYRIWGGRRLANFLKSPLPDEIPIGEAWVLSDRDDFPSIVAEGSLKGQTISQLFNQFPEQIMGKQAGQFSRFPLLLKFLDTTDMLSVQVHPSDLHKEYIPDGEHGKTEVWYIMETDSESLIYAGLKQRTNADDIRQAIADKTVAEHLASFIPKPGDGVFLQAGTVHSMGNVVVFEVQQNSDMTFRLYDWDHIDAKTGKQRALQIDEALACIDYSKGAVGPVVPIVEVLKPVLRERLFLCEHFGLWRISGNSAYNAGVEGIPRVLVCIEGKGNLEYDCTDYPVNKGDVFLLPAVVGTCNFKPDNTFTLLEISLPEYQI